MLQYFNVIAKMEQKPLKKRVSMKNQKSNGNFLTTKQI